MNDLIKNNNKKKSILIIGCGISGLAAGIYGQLNGFNCTIIEKNNFPGGNLTGWYRNGFYIDNCIHWLTGTNSNTKLYKLWEELGVITKESKLNHNSALFTSHYNNQQISLTDNLEKTKEAMLTISPSDKKEINRFINAVKFCQAFNNGKKDITNNIKKTIGISKLLYYKDDTLLNLSLKFNHPLLQKVFTDYLPKDYSALALIFVYATFLTGNGDIPCEGSKVISERLANKFITLGGKIKYNTNVTKIIKSNKDVLGVILDNKVFRSADYVISTIDPNYLFKNIVGIEYMPQILKKRFFECKTISSFHTAYATKIKPKNFNGSHIINISPINIGKCKITRLCIREYSYLNNEDGYVIQSFIPQFDNDYDYWEQLHLNKEKYKNIKKQIALKIQKEIEKFFPELEGNLTYLDSWTPVTYNSYFNNYKGAYMSFIMDQKINLFKISNKIKNLNNLYLAGVWLKIPGGLPTGAQSGKDVILKIAKKEKMFVSSEATELEIAIE